METNFIIIIIGICIVSGFGVFSYLTKIVGISGLISGLVVGLIIWIFGGWSWFIVILFFHLFAALMTKFKYKKKEVSGLAQEKGGARGWPNVIANGMVATVFALTYGGYFLITGIRLDIFFFGYIGSVAAMTADTVATEIGLLSKSHPRLITTFKKVIPGTSGGVTLLGEAAALLGSGVIGILSWILASFNLITLQLAFNLKFFVIICAVSGGLFGCLADSIIGATVQGLYNCTACNKITEKKIHGCGTKTEMVQGYEIIDNNVVNVIGSLSGSIFSILFYILLIAIFGGL